MLFFFCLVYVYGITMQAMQYASPQAIWNLFFGVNRPTFEMNEGIDIFQIVSYGHFLFSFPVPSCTHFFFLLYLFICLFYLHIFIIEYLKKSGTVYFKNDGSVDCLWPFSLSIALL